MDQSHITRLYRIDLKDIPERYRGESLLKILPNSTLRLKAEVEKFAYYFRREGHYDFVQFEATDTGPYTAYLFASDERRVWIGACCFRTRLYADVGIPIAVLQWIWLHPYFRGRGVLRRHWQTLHKEHGDFYVEPPLSHGMRGFLLKNAKDSVWYPLYEGNRPDLAEIKVKLTAAGKRNGGSAGGA